MSKNEQQIKVCLDVAQSLTISPYEAEELFDHIVNQYHRKPSEVVEFMQKLANGDSTALASGVYQSFLANKKKSKQAPKKRRVTILNRLHHMLNK